MLLSLGSIQCSPRLPLLKLLFVAINYSKVSLWLRKTLKNSEIFSLVLYGHPVCFAATFGTTL